MSQNALARVSIFVDGSCLGNPGPGGWAAILQCGQHEKEVVGGADHTTNNRMELTAVLEGLKALKRRCQVTVVTDSQYVVTILIGGKAKANLDLVQQLYQLVQQHDVTVEQIRGHSGHPLNERCDRLAQTQAMHQRTGQTFRRDIAAAWGAK
ncbi:MAG TPA: ribonuclease HI [Chloroflexota bacterium]|nr:ribonuclease HI [Chloroflexota bacterium]HUM69929.1 ribonuclease HI [Chloroflexota bacterium]